MPLAVRLEVLVAAVLCMWGAPAHCRLWPPLCCACCREAACYSSLAQGVAFATTRSFALQAPLGLWYYALQKSKAPALTGPHLSCPHTLITRCLTKQHQQRFLVIRSRLCGRAGMCLSAKLLPGRVTQPRGHRLQGSLTLKYLDLRRQPAPGGGAAAHQRAGKPGVSAPATTRQSVFCAARKHMPAHGVLCDTGTCEKCINGMRRCQYSALVACCSVPSSFVLSAGAWMPTRSGRTSWRSTTAGR